MDWILAAVLALSILVGVWRGFTREVLGLASWLLSVAAALWFAPLLSPALEGHIATPSIRSAAAYGLVFVAGLIVGALITALVSALVRKSPLSGMDRAVGAGFGLLRGLLLATVAVWLVGLTPARSDPWWRQSALIGPLQGLATAFGRVVPDHWARVASDGAAVAHEGI